MLELFAKLCLAAQTNITKQRIFLPNKCIHHLFYLLNQFNNNLLFFLLSCNSPHFYHSSQVFCSFSKLKVLQLTNCWILQIYLKTSINFNPLIIDRTDPCCSPSIPLFRFSFSSYLLNVNMVSSYSLRKELGRAKALRRVRKV